MLTWLTSCVLAAREYGIDILDGVYNDISNAEGFAQECAQARDFGFDGKTLIHPNQIDPCNAAFSPAPDEVATCSPYLERQLEIIRPRVIVTLGRPAAQQRLQPRGDLLQGERLDDVVVGAGLQAADAVVDLVARAQDADRRLVAAGAQSREDLEAVEVGHGEVEQDDRGRDAGDRLQGGAPTGRGDHREALELQARGDGAADGGVVVDQQNDRATRRVVIHASHVRSRG